MTEARTVWISTGVVILVAAILRAINLGADGLWVDEAYTAEIIRGPWSEITVRLKSDEAPPLFYYLQKLASAFGSGETALRWLPCLAGIVTAAVASWLLHAAENSKSYRALVVGLTFATSTLLVFYAQQARSYSWVHLLELGLLANTIALRERVTHLRGVLWVLFALGLLYSHNLALWPVLAALLFYLPRGRQNLRATATILTLSLVGATPWILSVIHQIGMHRGLNTWMGDWWTERFLLLGPLYSIGVFANGIAPFFRPPIPLPGVGTLAGTVWIALAIVMVGLIAGVGIAFRNSSERRIRELTIGAILFTTVPLFGLLATSLLLGPAYVVGRTDTFALPGFLLWISLGWSQLPKKWGITCLVCWVGLGLFALLGPEQDRSEKQSDRALAQLLSERAAPNEPVWVGLLGQPSLRYYARKLGFAEDGKAIRGYPSVAELNPAAVFPLPVDSLSVYLEEAKAIRMALDQGDAEALWVTSTLHTPPSPWPKVPTAPPSNRAFRNANDLPYPMSLLVYSFVGLDSIEVAAEYRQDWIDGSRVLLRIPRSDWIDPDDLPPIEEQG